MTRRQRLALLLHGWAYKLEPKLWLVVRQIVIDQLVAEQDEQLARHRQHAARAAQNN